MDTATLNVEYLTNLGACKEAIHFVKRNNLEQFPVSRINEIKGDNCEWVNWIKDMLNSVQEYDTNGKLIHSKDFNGYEYWKEYDSNGNLIHYKHSNGFESWNEYDTNGNLIHSKDFNGYEYWKEYDSNGNEIHSKGSNGSESWKEYDSNRNLIHYKHSNGFESWNEYDSNRNLIHYKNSDGYEYWKEYDSNGNEIHYKDSNGSECSFHVEYYPSGQLKRYGNMILPELDNDSPTCYINKTNGEVKLLQTILEAESFEDAEDQFEEHYP